MGPFDWLQEFLQPSGQNQSMYGQNEGHESHAQSVFAEAARVAQEEHEAYLRLQQAPSQPQPQQVHHQNQFAESNAPVYRQNQFTGSNHDRYHEDFLPSQFQCQSPYGGAYGPPVDEFTHQHYVRPSDINSSPAFNQPNASRQAYPAPSFNPMTAQRQARPASEQPRSIDIQSAQPSQEMQGNPLPLRRTQTAMPPRDGGANHQTDIRSRPEKSSEDSTQQGSGSPPGQHKRRAFLDPAMTTELFPTTSPGSDPYTSAARSTLASRQPPASRSPAAGIQSPNPSGSQSQHQRPSNSATRQGWNGPTSGRVTSTSVPSTSGPPGRPASGTPTAGTQSPGPSVAQSQHNTPPTTISALKQMRQGPTSGRVTSTSTPSTSGPPASRTPTTGTQSPGLSVSQSQHQRPSNSATRPPWNVPTSGAATNTPTPSTSGPPDPSNVSRPSPAPKPMVQRQQQPVSQVSAPTEAQKPASATQNGQDGIPRQPDRPGQLTNIPKPAAATVQSNPVPNRSIGSGFGQLKPTSTQATRRPGAIWKMTQYVPNTSQNPPSVPQAADAPPHVSASGIQVPTSTPGPQVPTPRPGPQAPPSSSVPTGPRLDSLKNYVSADHKTSRAPVSNSQPPPAQQMPWHKPAPTGTMPNGLPASKKRQLDNGAAHNVNAGVTPFDSAKYVCDSPSRKYISSRNDLVRPIKQADAAEKESYDPATIARDVLISASRHPTERGLNEHLDPLRQNTVAVETNADLDTFRWDIVDPRDPSHRPPTGAEASANRDRGVSVGAAAAPVQQSPRAPPIPPPTYYSPGPYHAHPPPSHPPLAPPSHLPSRPPHPVHAGTPTELPTPPANQSTKSPSKPPGPRQQPSIPPTPSSKRSTPPQTQPSPHARKYPEPQVVIPSPSKPSPSKMPRPRKSVGRPKKEDQVKVAPPPPPTEYQVFHCKWANCQAELHNLLALQSHVMKAHIPNHLTCGWAGCKNVTVMTAADQWKHVQEAHIRPIVWTLGDGPKVSAPGEQLDLLPYESPMQESRL